MVCPIASISRGKYAETYAGPNTSSISSFPNIKNNREVGKARKNASRALCLANFSKFFLSELKVNLEKYGAETIFAAVIPIVVNNAPCKATRRSEERRVGKECRCGLSAYQ